MDAAWPALLGSDGASAGDEAADEAGGVEADALSSAPELRPSAALDMALRKVFRTSFGVLEDASSTYPVRKRLHIYYPTQTDQAQPNQT